MDAITQFDLNILHAIHEGISCGFLDAVFPKLTLLCYLFIGAAVVFLFFRKFRSIYRRMCRRQIQTQKFLFRRLWHKRLPYSRLRRHSVAIVALR